MECDWTCPNPVFLDFETQSYAELTTTHKYASADSTRALTCCIKVDGVMHRFGPYLSGADLELMSKLTEGRTICAHNAPFDCAIWEITCGLPHRKWCDTLPMARAAGFPGRLEDICQILWKEGKSKTGKLLIDMLCILKGPVPPADNPAYKLLLDYNDRDVELLERVWKRVRGFGVPATMTVDRNMNDRGIPVCREHLTRLSELFAHNKDVNAEEFDSMTGGVNPNSPKQLAAWMQSLGFPLGSCNKHVIAEFQKNPDRYYDGEDSEFSGMYELLSGALDRRKEIVRVGKGKVDAALAMLEDDGRIRDMLSVYNTTTGRWTSRGPQFHNMPNNPMEIDLLDLPLTVEAVRDAATRATAASKHSEKFGNADVLAVLIRHMVRADNLLVGDFNAVELRMAYWMAQQQNGLQVLGDPQQSIYSEMATKLFGYRVAKKSHPVEYTAAKTLVLGCIYGISEKKFRADPNVKDLKIDFDKLACVKTFRETYSNLPALWKQFHDAMHTTITSGYSTNAGPCQYHMVGSDMHLLLPSSRVVVYRNARIEPRVPGYCKLYNMPEEPIDTVVYDSTRYRAACLWGSKAVENADQGMCADMIAEKCVILEAAGMHPVLTVHDEVVCEDPPERFDEYMEIMSTPSTWAPGFPLLTEGYSGALWTKRPKRYRNLSALNGRILE